MDLQHKVKVFVSWHGDYGYVDEKRLIHVPDSELGTLTLEYETDGDITDRFSWLTVYTRNGGAMKWEDAEVVLLRNRIAYLVDPNEVVRKLGKLLCNEYIPLKESHGRKD